MRFRAQPSSGQLPHQEPVVRSRRTRHGPARSLDLAYVMFHGLLSELLQHRQCNTLTNILTAYFTVTVFLYFRLVTITIHSRDLDNAWTVSSFGSDGTSEYCTLSV